MPKVLLLGIAAAAVGGLATGAATATVTTKTGAAKARVVTISTRKLPKLGTILVNAKGLTLYMFVPDRRKRVTCVHTCAAIWPPVKLPKGGKIRTTGRAKASLLGNDRDPTGGRVVTYNKWPLYTYLSDKRPGQATGQALKLNGGLWYVLNPSGKVIKTKR